VAHADPPRPSTPALALRRGRARLTQDTRSSEGWPPHKRGRGNISGRESYATTPPPPPVSKSSRQCSLPSFLTYPP
jgi:hypothetical protein